jgi:hypothetical protein
MSPTTDITNTFYPIAADVKQGYGAQLLVGVGDVTPGPETFKAVKGIVSIDPGSLDTAKMKVTHLRSPRAAHEYSAAMRDMGNFVIKARWLPSDPSQSNQAGDGTDQPPGLLNLSVTRKHWNFIVRLTDGDPTATPPVEPEEYPFSGFVSKYKPGTFDDTNPVDLDIEITPDHDYTEALP